jgi:hypothetical protein
VQYLTLVKSDKVTQEDLQVNRLYLTRTYNRLPDEEPSGSKHVEDTVKIKISV